MLDCNGRLRDQLVDSSQSQAWTDRKCMYIRSLEGILKHGVREECCLVRQRKPVRGGARSGALSSMRESSERDRSEND
jgi:hypothetical protein